MVNTTVKDIVLAQNAINTLLQLKLPVKAAYRVQKIARKLVAEADDFEKVRQATVAKYMPTEEGAEQRVAPKDLVAFQAELEPLLDEVVELDIPLIPLSLIEGTSMTVSDVMALAFVFYDDTEIENDD